ncbi:inositol 2-dehydrogenase [Saccharopolyspora subtropica]|uniref:Inositol 2-dehydrogenase n=1 Tax=Saccharopolyspora thermophila TaxID=89367 RepID=A0A917JSQ0_9PSEU|nr:Gfo/Idh/MocA family oxidoreductase [Saccharopolyspora subtropica]GGI84326.1 inositol 2-dehydrogenase [Saccharopolyspora subtropica]
MTNQDLRVGLVGAGKMGADHALRIHERISGARLVAVADPDLDRAQQVADTAGARAQQDPFEVIAASDVDAVVIASPGVVHEPLLLAAIERGVPVLCEKPLTPDPKSSLRVLEAEEARGRRLVQVGFMRRFDAEYAELKRLLDTGELGRPLLLHCAHRNPTAPPGFTSQMMIFDSVVHEFDATRWLLGQELTAVSVRAGRSTALAAEGLVDPQVVSIETTGGVLVDVEIFVNCGFGYQVRCEAVGERGTALIGGDRGPVLHRGGQWGGAITADFRDRFGAAFDREVQRWADAARRGEVDRAAASAWDGYAAAAACEAGVQAQASGQRTEVELVDRPDFYA